jgi:Insertion element 4 transposase N-terminal/Transposase DDE domain
MSWGWLSPRGGVLARAGIGVLGWVIPPDLVDEAVGDGLAREMRLRSLPSRLGVYFVLGLCLFSHLPYAGVVRELVSGLEEALAGAGWRVPAPTSLTAVRRRLGEKPFRVLAGRLASGLSPGRERWSHICGLLAVAWDGTTVKAAASAENIAVFGRPGTTGATAGKGSEGGQGSKGQGAQGQGAGEGHYPQLRLVALITCGARGLLGAAMGPLKGKGTGERALAAGLLGYLRAGMLLLADRNFCSFELWNAAAATGAGLLWRVKDSMHLPVVQPLPDGSWITAIPDPAEVRRRTVRNGARRRRGSRLPPDTSPVRAIQARVIEFWVRITAEDGTARAERFRVLTTLTDHRAYPAGELAAGYGWRWAIETGFREFKTYLRGPGRILRSRTPELARQELWAYLVLYQAIRAVMCLAAASAGLDPDKISFTAALHAVRRTLPAARARPDAALAMTEASLLAALVPERHGRVWVRAIWERTTPFPSKHGTKKPLSQHAGYSVTIHHPARTAHTTTDQPRPPQNTENQPP